MDAYVLIKFLHILTAVVAVGIHLSLLVWLKLTGTGAENTSLVLQGMQILDKRYSGPGYIVILVTGLAMMGMGPYPHTSTWLIMSVVLMIVILGVAHSMFTPSLKKLVVLASEQNADNSSKTSLEKKVRRSGWIIFLLSIAIVYFMIFKPM